MSETKHTPGPWQREGMLVYAFESETTLCLRFSACVHGGWAGSDSHTSPSELVANARLIASAPDLLDEGVQVAAYLRNGVTCTEIANVRGDSREWERWDCIKQEAPKDEWCERCTNLHGLEAALARARGEG